MADKKLIKQWMDEKDEALLSFNVEKMKMFYLKWQAKGVYKNPLQSEAFEGDIDDVICYLHDEADFSGEEIYEVMNEPLFKRGRF